MATPPNKPRDIKDLKARLGKGLSAGQSGASVRPSARPAAGSVPPPAIGGFPTRASAPPPAVAGVPTPGIVKPAFAQQQPAAAAAPRPSQAPAASASPFEASGRVIEPAEKKVTLVIDDSAVKDDEIGRKSRFKSVALIGVGAVLGIALGFGLGSTGSERTQYNLAVHDGKEIYARINEASTVLEDAKKHLKKAVDATMGGPGKKAGVDYAAIEALVGLENPFTANEFHGRRYRAFPQNVVNDLFDYYNNVNILWSRFTTLRAKTAGENKRKALDESAKNADALMSSQYGMVVLKSGDLFSGGLVVMRAAEEQEEGAPPKMLVASREGGREVERQLWIGQDDFAESYDNYVLAVDKGRSMGLLGTPAQLFGELRGDLTATQALMDNTIETQGRLIQELGKVAALEEQSLF